MEKLTKEQESKVKDISMHNKEFIESMLQLRLMNVERSGLDPKTYSLCQIAALVAIDAPLPSYAWQVRNAMNSGVTADDIIGVLVALAPTLGMARVAGAATKLAELYNIKIEMEEIEKRAA